MTNGSLILQAIEIMFVGMGIVIMLLALLVLCTHVMSVLLREAAPEAGQSSTLVNKDQKAPSSKIRIAAIVAATEHHRQIRSRS